MGISLKSEKEIALMQEGGKILSFVKDHLFEKLKEGISAIEIEEEANIVIKKHSAEPSFKMVPGYKWATCINLNDGVVHGIPQKTMIFKKDDIVSVDVGVYFRGFHTDSAFTKYLGADKEKINFLKVGRTALDSAIANAVSGNTIRDISASYEKVLKKNNLSPIYSLTGHGVGRNLHEDPLIPCYVDKSSLMNTKIVPGMTLALEIMYTTGKGDIVLDNDGWTLRTKDGTIAALFEDTVAIFESETRIITA